MPLPDISLLPKAIQLWLDYQFCLNREMLFSEALLGYPIGEFVRTFHGGDIRCETAHPNFKTTARGRPRQIDYVLLGSTKGRMESAIEAKWINNQKADKQRVVDDLFRLECLRDGDQHVERFFLVGGLTQDFAESFRQAQANTPGGRIQFFDHILPWNAGEKKRVEVEDSVDPYRSFFKSFAEAYHTKLPSAFEVTLLKDCTGEHVRVALWSVASSRKRREFDCSNAWKDVAIDTEDVPCTPAQLNSVNL